MADQTLSFNLSCPIPIKEYPAVTLAHGGGGRLTQQLIEKIFAPAFHNPALDRRHDGATLDLGEQRLAFTTDSFVVRPLFFPGGDIGHLAICGTVNDLAMCGARPLWLSAGFILEEGLAMESLWRVVQSMRATAQAAGIELVTGDTKVVDKGKGDQIFINTTGIGVIEHDLVIDPTSVRPGDKVLLSGDIGRHGIAIMAEREGLAFETTIQSDAAVIAAPALALIEAGLEVHCLRDLTRGGLATTLIEIAETAALGMELDERAIPVLDEVRGACEILGFDPLYVANEGRFAAIVAAKDAERALEILNEHALGLPPAIIGEAREEDKGRLILKSQIGTRRILDMLSGEQLPRIC